MWWPYTNSDAVVDDNGVGFRYSFSALKDRQHGGGGELHLTRRTAGRLTELVGRSGSRLRYGRNLLKMDVFGCTSRGQAQSCRAVGDKDWTAGNADGGFHARVTGAASHTRRH